MKRLEYAEARKKYEEADKESEEKREHAEAMREYAEDVADSRAHGTFDLREGCCHLCLANDLVEAR